MLIKMTAEGIRLGILGCLPPIFCLYFCTFKQCFSLTYIVNLLVERMNITDWLNLPRILSDLFMVMLNVNLISNLKILKSIFLEEKWDKKTNHKWSHFKNDIKVFYERNSLFCSFSLFQVCINTKQHWVKC